MGGLGIGGIAQQHSRWLLARQNAIASNIANASTPGYRATDVKPFSALLERRDLAMSATNAAHIQTAEPALKLTGGVRDRSTEVSHSGNTVSLNRQMIMANEVRQGYALNTSVVRAFHRFLLSAAK